MDVDAMGSSDASVARLSSGRWARETGLIMKKETEPQESLDVTSLDTPTRLHSRTHLNTRE
jgi:hypothetical protein